MVKRITVTDDKKHHEYGGSTAKRWMTCTACMEQVKKDKASGLIPLEQRSGPAAEEGTRAHNLAELCLVKGYDPEDFFMQEFEGATITDEYINAVKVYVDYCNDLISSKRYIKHGIEDTFDLTKVLGGDAGGSADFAVISGLEKRKTLEVVDYKHGRGIVVDVEGNHQARLYALGFYERLVDAYPSKFLGKIKKIKLTIVQPRISHVDGPIRSETINVEDLQKFKIKAIKAIAKGKSGDGVYIAGDHCTFCPRAGYCEELSKQNMELAQLDFASIGDELPAVNQLTKNEVELLLINSSRIKKWLDAVEVHAVRAADQGETFDNFKLVQRFGHRKFSKKDKAIVRKLKKAGYDSSMFFETKARSPAQLEAHLKAGGMTGKEAKEFVDLITEKPELGVSLAKSTDGRETAKTTAESDFADVAKSNKTKKVN